MKLGDLEQNWDGLAERDPLWAVLAHEDKRGGRWDEDEFFAIGREEARNVVAYLREIRPDLRAGAALDFGCGVGRVTLALADHFERVVGVDIAAGMVERARGYARTRGCASCSFVHNARPDLALFPSETFDLVYSNLVLQHMEPRYAVAYVAEFLRVAAPGGLVLFQLPEAPPATRLRARMRRRSPAFVRRRYDALARRRRHGREPVMEMHGVPRADVVAAVERHGGAVIEVRDEGDLGCGFASLRYCVRRLVGGAHQGPDARLGLIPQRPLQRRHGGGQRRLLRLLGGIFALTQYLQFAQATRDRSGRRHEPDVGAPGGHPDVQLPAG